MVSLTDLPQNVQDMVARVTARDPHATEFLQAFEEVTISLAPVFAKNPEQLEVFERLSEPERLIQFRVAWSDDAGKIQVNRGFRVQYSSAIGPYKGGLRFHPSVNKSILCFLGFEQIFKNALTGLPMGGGKGGSDFNPKGKSDAEIMRFCQSFMTELYRHIGPDTDVPAGDIGVGGREIGYLFGQYKRLANNFTATLTGRGHGWGGSLIRPEATGYGAVYFLGHMLEHENLSFEGAATLVSGSGNVAQYACEKLIEKGAKVLSLSDSSGTVIFKNGLTTAALADVMEIKNVKRGRIHEITTTDAGKAAGAEYHAGKRPWGLVDAVYALPCATQNEIELGDAEALVAKGIKAVSEGANMPTTNDAIDFLKSKGVVVGVAKAANAGGVAVSGLEMAQGSQREFWTREQVDSRLKAIMAGIFQQCQEAAKTVDLPANDYQAGANIAGFLRVAKAMNAFGAI